ncbi:putative DBH-like monooxygenase protein 2 [Rhinatrema bivittatum]|uniref:putative DBH-like monooxygenase protein 2 n=1 Tax=Rhinatrema bivittatum TaxID=194408 RepID=UPI0011274CAF|nr:putative DBH-like monooxygenase protein 2 [Rhinatrema bivittatum]
MTDLVWAVNPRFTAGNWRAVMGDGPFYKSGSFYAYSVPLLLAALGNGDTKHRERCRQRIRTPADPGCRRPNSEIKPGMSSCADPLSVQFSRVLDPPKGSVELRWGVDHDKEVILFELQVKTIGWIGFGLSPSGELEGSDMVIGGVHSDKSIYFSDRHMKEEWPPEVDEKQNYELLSLTQNETTTTMVFRRALRTCDPDDQDITNDTMRVISLYGLDDSLQYEEEHKYVKSIYLMVKSPVTDTPSTYFTYDIKLNNFPIPVTDTTYACTFIPMPTVNEKHHIFLYDPRIDPNSAGLVHHILVYACANNTNVTSEVGDCYGSDPTFSQCSQVIFGWAVGGSAFHLPKDVGIPLGTSLDPLYIRLEIHFSNFDAKEGIFDNSGITIFYTPELRKHDAGILQVGVFTFPMHFIPPGAENYKSYGLCKTEKFHEVNGWPVENMKVLAYLLHSHLTARGIKVIHYRNGTQIGVLGQDDKYDFRLQESRHHRYTIDFNVGDEVLVECTANTMDRDDVTYGGPSTLNEMCLAFLFFYPRNNISTCWSYTDLPYVTDILGQEHTTDIMEAVMNLNYVEWDNETIRLAEKASKEAVQTVIVQNRKGTRLSQPGLIPDIEPPILGPCDDTSFDLSNGPSPAETHGGRPVDTDSS